MIRTEGLYAVNGRFTGSQAQPTELTVSQSPRKCTGHGLPKVLRKPLQTSSFRSFRKTFDAYGTMFSWPGSSRPHLCTIAAMALAV